jgi:hypothetical protein
MHARAVLWSTLLLTVWGLACSAGERREPEAKKFTLHAPRAAGAGGELMLLPSAEQTIDGDAFVLYEKAVKSLPKDLDWEKIQDWRKVPLDQLPLSEIDLVLRPFDASLPLLEQAARCRKCDWPVSYESDSSVNLQAFRNLAFLFALKARSQLARGDCEACVRTLGTGLALAKHLNGGPTAIHLLVGVAIGAVIFGEIEQYVQQPGAPSLEAAIRAIPTPLFDENHSDLYGADEDSRNRARLVLRRGNRHLLALEYIETVRAYAGKSGRWPETLGDLKASLPDDPVAGKPFAYKRLTETRATLEGPLPEGGGAKDEIRYELDLVK